MTQIALINAVLQWERRLEIEDERRKAYRLEPYRELPTDFEACQKESESLLAWVSKRDTNRQPAQRCYPQTCCQETHPG